jgi:hypothetical protein
MMESVLRHNPPIEARDRQFDGTAMDWVIHGALNPGQSRPGDTARLLLDAGAQVDDASLPTGHDALDQVLRQHFAGT